MAEPAPRLAIVVLLALGVLGILRAHGAPGGGLVSAMSAPVQVGQPRRTREEAIALYRTWLSQHAQQCGEADCSPTNLLVAVLAARHPTALACWCRDDRLGETEPPCHADVLVEALAARGEA